MSDQQDPRDEPSGLGGGSETDPSDLGVVPLFPLPNVVLFPRAVLPLHVFEERYKAMTDRALSGDRRIAMALLKSGWEKSYYSRPAIEPVVCVGTILTHEKLPDGKYNFLLQGTTRARIVREVGGEAYRLARLRSLPELNRDEETLAAERERMLDVFTHGPLGHTAAGRQFARLIKSPLPTPDLADLIAFSFLDDVPLKQSLLEEPDVRRRVRRIIETVEGNQPSLQLAYLRDTADPEMN